MNERSSSDHFLQGTRVPCWGCPCPGGGEDVDLVAAGDPAGAAGAGTTPCRAGIRSMYLSCFGLEA